jgi:tetratricopeptide (TPR) repeat protein
LPGSACQIAQSRDGHVLAIALQNDGALVLHSERPNQRVRLTPHEDVRYVALDPDGRLVATGSHGRSPLVKVWNADSGQLIKELPASDGSSVNFSPDGKWLATGGGGGHLWAVDSWHEKLLLESRHRSLVAFAPDAKMLAVETGSGVVRLVDPNTGNEYAQLEDPDQDRAEWIGFSPDGTKLITAVGDRQRMHLWDLRLIREELTALDLDWDLPKYPPAQGQDGVFFRVAMDRGSLPPPSSADARLDLIQYSLAIVLNPINPPAYRMRGRAYDRLGVSRRAVMDYSMFLALVPAGDHRRAEVLWRRSNDYRMLNQRVECLADLLQVVRLNLDGIPEFHDDLARQCNNLAWELVTGPEKERNPAKAVPLAEKAVDLRPDEWVYLNTLGVVQYRLGQFQAAVTTMERGIQASKKEATAFDLFCLAMCQHQLGDRRKARDWYDKALVWSTTNRSGLPPQQSADLDALQVEAAGVLGVNDASSR